MFLIKTDKARHELQPGRPIPADPAPVAVDAFDGKRSLATTRMFLFDLCERMFVRRDPVLAEQFREMLRESRDRDGMLDVAAAMLDEIEKAAGVERAATIRERIDKLLPAQRVSLKSTLAGPSIPYTRAVRREPRRVGAAEGAGPIEARARTLRQKDWRSARIQGVSLLERGDPSRRRNRPPKEQAPIVG